MVENWWTPSRVTYWLETYPQLAVAVRYGCAVDWEEVQFGHSSDTDDGIGAELASTLCDLDLAIDALPNGHGRGICRHLRRVAHLRWREGATGGDIAAEVGCTDRHALRKVEEARHRIIRRLCA